MTFQISWKRDTFGAFTLDVAKFNMSGLILVPRSLVTLSNTGANPSDLDRELMAEMVQNLVLGRHPANEEEVTVANDENELRAHLTALFNRLGDASMVMFTAGLAETWTEVVIYLDAVSA